MVVGSPLHMVMVGVLFKVLHSPAPGQMVAGHFRLLGNALDCWAEWSEGTAGGAGALMRR